MATYKVEFLPYKKKVEVDEGTTLLEAAERAGVYINSICGGKGVCGKCKLKVEKGNVSPDKHSLCFFKKEEIETGYVLACQTNVYEDLVVRVPEEARLEGAQILTDEMPMSYSDPESISVARLESDPASLFDPLVRKVFLELPPPTIEDNISDIDRVIRELAKRLPFKEYEFDLYPLKDLARHLRESDWKATATVESRNSHLSKILMIEPGDTSKQNYGVAVDIGTTTIVAQLIDLSTGKVLGTQASHNKQVHYGEDVISRIIFACSKDGREKLHEAVIETINTLIANLCSKNDVKIWDILSLVAAGNTTMSHLFYNLEPCNIRLEPYIPTVNFYPPVRGNELGIKINPRGLIHAMPSVASYVGGDITAGILATGIADRPEIRGLIDVGTNGEIAIGNNEWLVCCSASAGPAFEGGGISHGMRATKGAIQKLTIEKGNVTYETIGNDKPTGICGSGLIDTLLELFRNGIIGPDGKFDRDRDDERLVIEDGEPAYILAKGEESKTGKPILITESDLSNLIMAKGAIFAAIKSLMDYMGLSLDQIEEFYVAGGFGNYLDISKAIGIGLLPDMDTEKIKFIGNSSLLGARMGLLSNHAMERARGIARRMTYIELSSYLPFMDEYKAALFIPHTEERLFPSVKKLLKRD